MVTHQNLMNKTIALAKALINRRSITPEDAGCQKMLADRLEPLDFVAEYLRYENVDNLWITHGQGDPVFAFIGHTDVVPTGDLAQWHSPPFEAAIRDGYLYGRGAADMKGSIASFITAVEKFTAQYPDHLGTIALLITSDEEGAAIHGTRKVIQFLQENNIRIQWCLVGEPSSHKKLGDVIKNGRRGSLSGKLIVHGIQGHVAYPHLADNPVHRLLPALDDLFNKVWDKGNEFYPASSFQISNIHAGTGADNVIPGSVEVIFNYRFGTASNEQSLTKDTKTILDKYQLNYELDWHVSGEPFLTTEGKLLDAVRQSVKEIAGYDAELSTGGGTSDGRFIAPTGAEVVELGPVNASIHKINECVSIKDLELLANMYYEVLQQLFN